MRFKLPEGCAGASHAGAVLRPDRYGVIEAHPDAAAALAAHDILPVADAAPPEGPRSGGSTSDAATRA